MRSPNTKICRENAKQRPRDKFSFPISEIHANSNTQSKWHRFVRTQEIETILSLVENCRFAYALEIRSGDGLQSKQLADRCGKLICSDIDRRRWNNRQDQSFSSNVAFNILNATDLFFFEDNSFDLVYSSNVFGHIENIDTCLSEIYRVLKLSGIGIHSMPSRH